MRRGFDNFIPLVRGAWSNWGAALFAPYNIDKIPLDSACLMAKISIYLLWGPDYFTILSQILLFRISLVAKCKILDGDCGFF